VTKIGAGTATRKQGGYYVHNHQAFPLQLMTMFGE
jgi:hypothetical protein